jgi:hypothetical protein
VTQSLVGVLDGLFAACQAAFLNSVAADGSPVAVFLGDPGQYQPQAIVAVTDCGPSQQVTRPTLGPSRSRELAAEVSVMISVYTPGGNEAHSMSLDQVATLIRLLEDYIRTSPNEKLGGACYDSWVSAVAGPVGSVAYDPAQTDVATGRTVDATVTVTARIRY